MVNECGQRTLEDKADMLKLDVLVSGDDMSLSSLIVADQRVDEVG